MMMEMNMTREVLDFKENVLEFEKRIKEAVGQVKYCDEIGSVIEYSGDEGVIFTVDVMDTDGDYLFNFGDVSFSVNEAAFQGIIEKIRAATEREAVLS